MEGRFGQEKAASMGACDGQEGTKEDREAGESGGVHRRYRPRQAWPCELAHEERWSVGGWDSHFRESQDAGWRCRAELRARVRSGETRLPLSRVLGQGSLDTEGDRPKGGCRPPVPSTGLGWVAPV